MIVSVAMTTYKSKTYIKEQLESIFCQTRLPDEIVICDDASPDDTFDYVRSITDLAPTAIEIHNYKNEYNLGYQSNFQQCMQRCRGDVIFLCDADDVWDAKKVEKVMDVFETEENVAMCFHDAVVIDGEGRVIKESLNQGWDIRHDKADSRALLELEIRRKGCPNGMTMAISKELMDFSLPFMEAFGHDEWLIMCAPLLGKVVCIEDRLACYRRHSNNTSGNKLSVKQRIKCLDRGGWFTHPDKISSVFTTFKSRYDSFLPESTRLLLEKRIRFDTEMIKIASTAKYGGGALIWLWLCGIYKEFRGNRNTFLIDEIYLLCHLGDYLKEKIWAKNK